MRGAGCDRGLREQRDGGGVICALHAMLQTVEAAHEFLVLATVAGASEALVRAAKLALQCFQTKLCKFQGAGEITSVALVVNG